MLLLCIVDVVFFIPRSSTVAMHLVTTFGTSPPSSSRSLLRSVPKTCTIGAASDNVGLLSVTDPETH